MIAKVWHRYSTATTHKRRDVTDTALETERGAESLAPKTATEVSEGSATPVPLVN